MSAPRTEEERFQAEITLQHASLAENLVSTACPGCGVRFAMLAKWQRDENEVPAWFLRCVRCGHQCKGETK